MKNKLAWLIATCAGVGELPKAPGTWGSALAVAVAWATSAPLALAAVFFLPGVWSAEVTSRVAGKEDPQNVVVDEAVGQWITLGGSSATWQSLLAGFVLFRFFDITKPWPARQLERLPGGWGIVMDDVMAGIYGYVVMLLLRWFNLIN